MLYPDELQALHCDKAFRQSDPTILLRYPHEIGRGREIRTPDILLPKQARYQAALYPAIRSGPVYRVIRSAIIRIRQPKVNYIPLWYMGSNRAIMAGFSQAQHLAGSRSS